MTKLLIPSEKTQLLEEIGENKALKDIKTVLGASNFRCEVETDEKGIKRVTFTRADVKNNKEKVNTNKEITDDQRINEEHINEEVEKEQNIGESYAQVSELDLIKYTSVLLKKLGITANLKGYGYIREAMLILYKDNHKIRYVTKEIYPEIAKRYKTTSTSVERTIRHAIKIIFEKGNQKVIEEILEYSNFEARFTNAEFFSSLAEYIKFTIDNEVKVNTNKKITDSQNINKEHINEEVEKEQNIEESYVQVSELDLIKYTSVLLKKLGITAKLRGYIYIRESMLILYKDNHKIRYVTKEIYPEIAKRYKTTSAMVERAIRCAIEVIFKKGNQKVIEEIFDYSNFKDRPTNAEFLSSLFEYIEFTTMEIDNKEKVNTNKEIKDGQHIKEEHINEEVQKEQNIGESYAQVSELDIIKYTSVLLKKLGITANLKGYGYIREAMLILYKDNHKIRYVTKEIYPEIAKRFKATSASVEQTIRRAIEVIFKKGNQKVIEEIFDYSNFKDRPTNAEFLSSLFEYIKFTKIKSI